jgi:hypothetical protein
MLNFDNKLAFPHSPGPSMTLSQSCRRVSLEYKVDFACVQVDLDYVSWEKDIITCNICNM